MAVGHEHADAWLDVVTDERRQQRGRVLHSEARQQGAAELRPRDPEHRLVGHGSAVLARDAQRDLDVAAIGRERHAAHVAGGDAAVHDLGTRAEAMVLGHEQGHQQIAVAHRLEALGLGVGGWAFAAADQAARRQRRAARARRGERDVGVAHQRVEAGQAVGQAAKARRHDPEGAADAGIAGGGGIDQDLHDGLVAVGREHDRPHRADVDAAVAHDRAGAQAARFAELDLQRHAGAFVQVAQGALQPEGAEHGAQQRQQTEQVAEAVHRPVVLAADPAGEGGQDSRFGAKSRRRPLTRRCWSLRARASR